MYMQSARAVAYYRQAALDEARLAKQQAQVREFAEANGLEIIQEFTDHGCPGHSLEGRPAFMAMMTEWIQARRDFQYVLCLDADRWGRCGSFAQFAWTVAECDRHGKQLVFTTMGRVTEVGQDTIVYLI